MKIQVVRLFLLLKCIDSFLNFAEKTCGILSSNHTYVKNLSIISSKSRNRGDFIDELESTAGFFLTFNLIAQRPAFGDSTGKFSTKATAAKRYKPRIEKAVSEFESLQSNVAQGNFAEILKFTEQVMPDATPALELFGSAQRKGEYPDAKSKKLIQLSKDFEASVSSMRSAANGRNFDEVKRSYRKAADYLNQYLTEVSLEPLKYSSSN